MTEFEKRCEDCACLVVGKDKVWCCDECFGKPCNEIDDCPEGVTVELVEKANDVKVPKNYVKGEGERKKSTRERKPNEDKRHIMGMLNNLFAGIGCDTELTNIEREMTFEYNGVKYKLTLAVPRK